VGELSFLETLQMSVNQVTGMIPSEIGGNTNLSEYYHGASIESHFWSSLILSSTGELQLSMNGINGTIPSEIGKLSLLSQLDLRGNSISGTLRKRVI
jgi:Leucine-rich repeat (LRR) protein